MLLVCAEYAGMADCAKQLVAQGLCRELAWKDHGKEQPTALFCRMDAPELPELENGYEQQLDVLRERTLLAERTAAEQAAQLERLRSDLSLIRSHEQDLEKTLNSVVNSTFWKASWPLRYLVSKCRQLWRTFPLFVFFATLRRVGFAGVMAQAKAKKEYKKLFPGKAMPADRFADVELLVKQAADQPAAPRISIVVPLYNTPHDFLVELLDSVQNQTYRNWELCMVDAGQDADVGALVQERASTDSRIRYRKLDSNEGIAGNTNQGFALATGEYIALLDHDDILHPCALWYVAEAIAKQGADFVYTDEVTFEGDIDHLTVYHFKPDYMLDNLRSNNYICHLSVFSAALLAKVGGDERAEFNGRVQRQSGLRPLPAPDRAGRKDRAHPASALLLAFQSCQRSQQYLCQDLLSGSSHESAACPLRPHGRAGGRGDHGAQHPGLLQDRLHHHKARAGQCADPQLRPFGRFTGVRGVHLPQDHLPGF